MHSSELVCLTAEPQSFAEITFRDIFCSLGQKLVEWHQLDVTSFLDQVTGFLSEHGQLDGHSTSPPQKCSRSVSMRPFGRTGENRKKMLVCLYPAVLISH